LSAVSSKKTATLDRALSRLGVLTRSQAAQAIVAGRVSVNARVCRDPNRWVDLETDRFALDGKPVAASAPVYLMMNKPRGLICSRSDEKGRATVIDALGAFADSKPMPVGRLDAASEGLLLFTNHSAWAANITDPESALSKTYQVQITQVLSELKLNRLRAGIEDPELGLLKARAVNVVRTGEKNQWLEVVLEQGKNRQIRRMLAAIDVAVLRLIRVAIGPLLLGNLAKGQVRPLAAAEVQALSAAPRATPAQKSHDRAPPNAP